MTVDLSGISKWIGLREKKVTLPITLKEQLFLEKSLEFSLSSFTTNQWHDDSLDENLQEVSGNKDVL